MTDAPRISDAVHLVKRAYALHPNLALTYAQVVRLLALEQFVAGIVVETFVDGGFLTKSRTGRYVRTPDPGLGKGDGLRSIAFGRVPAPLDGSDRIIQLVATPNARAVRR
jgi:hypothetical protein